MSGKSQESLKLNVKIDYINAECYNEKTCLEYKRGFFFRSLSITKGEATQHNCTQMHMVRFSNGQNEKEIKEKSTYALCIF